MRRLLLWAAIVLFAVGFGTYWAGEQTEVVVLRTADAAGRGYETSMWVVDYEGEPWVRVANPERGWYLRLLENPSVELVRNGRARSATRRSRTTRPTPSPRSTPRFARSTGSWTGGTARCSAATRSP